MRRSECLVVTSHDFQIRNFTPKIRTEIFKEKQQLLRSQKKFYKVFFILKIGANILLYPHSKKFKMRIFILVVETKRFFPSFSLSFR